MRKLKLLDDEPELTFTEFLICTTPVQSINRSDIIRKIVDLLIPEGKTHIDYESVKHIVDCIQILDSYKLTEAFSQLGYLQLEKSKLTVKLVNALRDNLEETIKASKSSQLS